MVAPQSRLTRALQTAALLAFAPALAGGAPVPARFMVVETGRNYSSLAGAVGAIGNGKGTVLIAPGLYRQCAVQSGGNVTYRAENSGSVIFDGITCEGKAALVLRGAAATVDGIVFQNLRVPDGNGAGIRLERGDLTVSNSLFRASEEGILTHDDPHATIRVDHSVFSRLGRCDRGLDCAHSIYVGQYGQLIVTNSRFEAGTGGHYIKSRAARVDITGNRFDDGAGAHTNYMIDLPNGSAGRIVDNMMMQGRNKDNYSAFITIAPEGRMRDSSGLDIRGNTAGFVAGLQRKSTFVANWTEDTPTISQNRLNMGIKVTDLR
ncbi:MAG: right-handed parallel beta-helix repeat-containing protein [Sphingobium sp.]